MRPPARDSPDCTDPFALWRELRLLLLLVVEEARRRAEMRDLLLLLLVLGGGGEIGRVSNRHARSLLAMINHNKQCLI